MKVKEKFGVSKVLAMLLAVLLLCSMIPIGTLMSVFAASIGEFTVTLKNDSQTVQSDDANVTMTLKTDARTTKTVKAVSGVATFESFVEDETEYYVSVSDAIGYEDVENFDLTVGQGDTTAEIELTALEKITISGKVLDENENVFEGATVELTGYKEDSTVTDAQGLYSFEAYKGKDYTITASGAEKYQPKSIIVTSPSDDFECTDLKLTIKEFTIATSSDKNGTITETSTVSYDGSKTITATANKGFRIDSFSVDNNEIPEAKDAPTYSTSFENIKENHNVAVTFKRVAYTVKFTVKNNGKVTYTDNSDITIDGSEQGTVEVKEIENGSIKIVASPSDTSKYRVSSVKIDGRTSTFTDNGKVYTNNNFVLNNSDHEFEVEFALNEYTVSLPNSISNGSASLSESSTLKQKKVKWGESVTIYGTPDEDYFIDFVKSNDETIEYIENDDGTFTSSVDNIKTNIKISLSFTHKSSCEDGSYEKTYNPSGTGIIVGSKEYLPIGTKVSFVAKSPYKRVRINGKDSLKGTNVDITLGNENGQVKSIDSVEVTKKDPNLWDGGFNWKDSLNIYCDYTAPTISDADNTGKWFNTPNKYSFTVSDTESGVSKVLYSKTNDINSATEASYDSDAKKYYFVPENEKFNGDYYVWAIDNCENTSAVKAVSVKIDQTKPQIDGFTIKKPSNFDKVLNFLTFGIFGNSKAVIEVSASDPTTEGGETVPYSGIAKITLFYGDVEVTRESKDFESGKAIFEINASFANDIYAQAEDFAGNKCDKIKSEKSNTNNKDKDVSVKLETVKPIIKNIQVTSDKNQYTDWVDGNFKIKVSAYDIDSGIEKILVSVNGTKVIENNYSDELRGTSETSPVEAIGDVDITSIVPTTGGKYTITTTITDNAGNETTAPAPTIVYLDNKAPYIKADGYTFNGTGISESSAVATDYGYYFKDETTVKITATDDSPSSGIDTISVFLKDINGNYVKVNNGIANVIKTTEEDATSVIDVVNDAISFKIPANFKGQIFAKATDNVKNTPESYETPNGAIVEDADKHSNTSSIEITPKTSKVGVQDDKYSYNYPGCAKDKNMSFSDTTDVPLYNDSADLNVVVNDSYSGIRKIEYTIIENGKETTKAVEYDNAGNAISGSDSGWDATKESGSNLVVTSKKTITVDGNHNNMVLRVVLTDKAGNQSYDYYVIGIDKDAPVITVKMNDDDNKDYEGFFNVNRTATFEVKERNFNNKTEDDKGAVFTVTVTDENGKKEDVNITPNFTLKPNSYVVTDAEEYSIYTMDYTFDKDGDYTFALQVTDLATNKTEDKDVSYENEKGEDIRAISNKFTVDKTKPVVTVTYDNNNVLNGNYYKADRTATITIAEHNFEAKDVKIIGKATDNATGTETTTTFPKESEWKNNGNNTYTATIHYANDSKYTFDIEYLDKAGNSIDDYKEEIFFVDKTAPTLEISGVGDKSANNGSVVPEIKLFDTNFNKDAVTIALTGVNRGGVDYSRSISDIINGQNIRYADFERVQMVDDIYTLSVKLVDMAGNETTKAITFSVNRFGSVYDISGLKDLIGKYLQKEKDVVFTETNVDTLNPESIKIKLTANGTPKDLVLDKDYTIAKVEEKWASWSRYTYTIKKDLFKNDGTYSLSVYSVDAAGNVNENIEESKKAEISFGVDKTKPVIVPIDFEDGKQYPVESKEVTIEIKDNLKLNGVKIYLNDKEVKYENDGETYKFSIPESNSKQNVRIVATDAAGNEHELFVKDFLVSTNIFARWYNNTPLFIGSIIGVVVIAIGIIALILFGKKKKNNG